jgi:hypothetical protein
LQWGKQGTNCFIAKILDAGGSNHSSGFAGRAQVTFATGRNGAVFGRRPNSNGICLYQFTSVAAFDCPDHLLKFQRNHD